MCLFKRLLLQNTFNATHSGKAVLAEDQIIARRLDQIFEIVSLTKYYQIAHSLKRLLAKAKIF